MSHAHNWGIKRITVVDVKAEGKIVAAWAPVCRNGGETGPRAFEYESDAQAAAARLQSQALLGQFTNMGSNRRARLMRRVARAGKGT